MSKQFTMEIFLAGGEGGKGRRKSHKEIPCQTKSQAILDSEGDLGHK